MLSTFAFFRTHLLGIPGLVDVAINASLNSPSANFFISSKTFKGATVLHVLSVTSKLCKTRVTGDTFGGSTSFHAAKRSATGTDLQMQLTECSGG